MLLIERTLRKVKYKRIRKEKHIKLILICFRNQTYQNAKRSGIGYWNKKITLVGKTVQF